MIFHLKQLCEFLAHCFGLLACNIIVLVHSPSSHQLFFQPQQVAAIISMLPLKVNDKLKVENIGHQVVRNMTPNECWSPSAGFVNRQLYTNTFTLKDDNMLASFLCPTISF